MAITNFIPELWAAQMLDVWFNESVFAALVNREYEGLASRGNTVHISGVVAPTIKDYKTGVSGARTTAADAISDTGVDLLIDQEKSFDFYVDDIDKAQAAGTMDAFTRNAGQGLAQDADAFLLSTIVTAAHADNVLDPVDLANATNPGNAAFNVVRDLRKALTKKLIPNAQRALIVNAEFESMLLGADSKLTAVDTSGSPDGLRNAALGRLLGFEVYVSENLPTTSKAQAVAIYRPTVAYVSQIEKTEAMRAQDKFADRLRGLHVYGAKVLRAGIGVAVYTDDVVDEGSAG